MAARLRYSELAPEGYAALRAFGHYVNTGTALEPVLLGMVYLRASVLNGCHFCIEAHKAELRKHHEPESRIEAVGTAPASEAFTARERAALAWTEVITRLGAEGASEEAYAAVSAFFSGKDLVDLSFAIANINAWNRMGVAFRPAWRPRTIGATPSGPGAPQGEAARVAGDEGAANSGSQDGRGGLPARDEVARAEALPGGGDVHGGEDDGGKVETE